MPNLAVTQSDLYEIERRTCKDDLRYLCREVLGMRDWDGCHDDLLAFLNRSARRKKLILMPRGHLKSSILTIGLSIQHLLRDPDTSILLTNAVWDKSRAFLSEIKSYLTDKSDLQLLFGKFESDNWRADEIIINQRSKANKTPTISTAGVERSTTGHHFKIIFLDDLVDRQTISTEDQRAKTFACYSDALDLLEPGGTLYIVGTRWHDADLYGDLMVREPGAFDVYQVGATRSGEIGDDVIFPKKFSKEILQDLLAAKGSYEFFSQYFNQCIHAENQHFKPPCREWHTLGEGSKHFVTFDPATSQKRESCDAVVIDGCFTKNAQLCAVEYKTFSGTEKQPGRMMDCIFDYVVRHGAKIVGVETNGGQEVYMSLIQEEMRKRRIFFALVGIHQHQDKFSRIMALQPRWESGNLLLKPGMVELYNQMLRFPVGSKVDILDAFAMIHQLIVAPMAEVSVPKKEYSYLAERDPMSHREWESLEKMRSGRVGRGVGQILAGIGI